MSSPDLEPAATRLADLVAAVPDRALGAPTPCDDTSLGDLLDHVATFALVFTAAATKGRGPGPSGPPPPADVAHLVDDWRNVIPQRLAALTDAWAEPEAWEGTTSAGGLDMPAAVAGVVALDEVVVHGWDIARATGQPFTCDPVSLEAVHGFVAPYAAPGREASREGLFGPVVPVPSDAPLLDRVLGLTGRDPAWTPEGGPGRQPSASM